ncbi:hypothetical protein B0A48_12693 [Cryoendolithus antarcticus]|uniref:F-box domain-containing protein n=1 Tax=Cryoendolithus antarcticus TaxID=1507870 RepID=A0A1V8SR62_9PEZI|nr:hypothetical protein B0A48_12693 [Cryoendolithus antarcticus]
MLNDLDHDQGILESSFSETNLGPRSIAAPLAAMPTLPYRVPAEPSSQRMLRPSHVTLLDLPPQIRAQIYALSLSPSLIATSTIHKPEDVDLLANDILPVNSRPDISHLSRPPALALASSALRCDVLEWWYGSHTFLLQVHNAATSRRCQTWMEKVLGELSVGWLRKLRLRSNLLVYDKMHLRSVRTFPEVSIDLSTGRIERVGERDEGVGEEIVEGKLAAFEQAWVKLWEDMGRQGTAWTVEGLGEVLRAFVVVSADAKPVNGYLRS